MAIDYRAAPSVGMCALINGRLRTWDGTAWGPFILNIPMSFDGTVDYGTSADPTPYFVGTFTPEVTEDAIYNAIARALTKPTPVGADSLGLLDSSTGLLKSLTLTNFAAYLASLAQTLTNKTTNALTLTGTTAVQGLLDLSNASAGQIKFPATQNASSDANTLDDCEKGTFTPSLAGSTTAGTATYSSRDGSYTKIGRLVIAPIYLNYSGHTGTGNAKVTGLPFLAAGTVQGGVVMSLVNNYVLSANTILAGYIAGGGTEITLAQLLVGGGGSTSPAVSASGQVAMIAIYYV